MMKEKLLQIYAKLKDLYLSMTLGNRIVASLLFTMLVVSLGYLIVGSIKPADPLSSTMKIYNGYRFSPNEQRAAENALQTAGCSDYQWIGDQLKIPVKRQAEYTAVLAEAKAVDQSNLARFMTAKDLSPWLSQKLVDIKMISAKERDCVDAIKRLNGIADAAVISNKRPEWNRNVWARYMKGSVAVTVEAVDNKPISDDTVSAVSRIVAAGFGITDLKEISIVDTKNSRAYDGNGEMQGGAHGEYLRHQLKHQAEWEDKLYRHLPKIDGLKIETSIVLTNYRSMDSFDVRHYKPTILVDHTLDYQFHKEGYDRFARPGQIAQYSRPLIDPSPNVSAKDLTDEKKNERETTNALPGTETKTTQLPYIPQKILTSIQLPRDHILKVWIAKNRKKGEPDPEPTNEQLQTEAGLIIDSMKNSVAKLLEPYCSLKTNPLDLVAVEVYDRIQEEVPELTSWEKVVLFLKQNWQNLCLYSLVLSGLVVLWTISKPQKPDNIVIYEGLETPLEALDARLKAKAEAEEAARRAEEERLAAEKAEIENSLGGLGDIRSLKDEIAELIAKNPEAAAAIIRQWIGNAVLVEAKA
ncbi:MAG: hypothetical protein LBH00_09420 [Planctomycetaceae bacterium]|jgi:flagellar M-ring protein FliF|nr:hypothetical protein [Planctomycetaceae bacterium]